MTARCLLPHPDVRVAACKRIARGSRNVGDTFVNDATIVTLENIARCCASWLLKQGDERALRLA